MSYQDIGWPPGSQRGGDPGWHCRLKGDVGSIGNLKVMHGCQVDVCKMKVSKA